MLASAFISQNEQGGAIDMHKKLIRKVTYD